MAPYKDQSSNDEYQYHVIYLPRGIDRLKEIGTSMIVPKNTNLMTAGNVPDCCYLVRAGSVIAYEYIYTGDRRVYNIMEPGSVFLEECLLLDKKSPVNFQTLTKCELIRIEKCDLKHAFKHNIDIVMDICESLATKFLSTMEYQRYSPKQDSEWKICKLLLMFIDHYGVAQKDGSILLNRKISHQMIADILAMNRVTVSRKMKDIKDKGFIDSVNGYLYFPDRERLQNYLKDISSENN